MAWRPAYSFFCSFLSLRTHDWQQGICFGVHGCDWAEAVMPQGAPCAAAAPAVFFFSEQALERRLDFFCGVGSF